MNTQDVKNIAFRFETQLLGKKVKVITEVYSEAVLISKFLDMGILRGKPREDTYNTGHDLYGVKGQNSITYFDTLNAMNFPNYQCFLDINAPIPTITIRIML
jgi:hypothetical protein